jgi:hypothetical protein
VRRLDHVVDEAARGRLVGVVEGGLVLGGLLRFERLRVGGLSISRLWMIFAAPAAPMTATSRRPGEVDVGADVLRAMTS